jgi:tRNA(adenine34) deaminase
MPAHPRTQTQIDEEFMREALRLAHGAELAGEVPVGAVVVDPAGAIVGRGYNRTLLDVDPSAHAEIVALREAAWKVGNHRLLECTLYATIEPCAMCAGALIQARITRLVYGADDPKAGAIRSVLQLADHPALNHHFAVTHGVLGEECGGLLRQFFRRKRGKTAQSSDEIQPNLV